MLLRRLDWSDTATNGGAAIGATAALIAKADAQVPAGILFKRSMSYSVHLLNYSIYAELAAFVKLSTYFLFIGRSRRCAWGRLDPAWQLAVLAGSEKTKVGFHNREAIR
jgi:hypothetical protein